MNQSNFGIQVCRIPAGGGESTPLTTASDGVAFRDIAWSPDGKKLAFTPSSNLKGPFSPIRIVSLEDGTTVTLKTGLGEADYWHVSWSPDSKRLAFLAIQGGEPELWLMKDFLPLVQR